MLIITFGFIVKEKPPIEHRYSLIVTCSSIIRQGDDKEGRVRGRSSTRIERYRIGGWRIEVDNRRIDAGDEIRENSRAKGNRQHASMCR
jgi:hypothetical protein